MGFFIIRIKQIIIGRENKIVFVLFMQGFFELDEFFKNQNSDELFQLIDTMHENIIHANNSTENDESIVEEVLKMQEEIDFFLN